MKTFDDGGCVYEISSTEDAHEVRVELSDLYPGRPMHDEQKEQQSCVRGERRGEEGRRGREEEGRRRKKRNESKTMFP